MATPSKAQLLTNVHDLLKKRYKPKADRPPGRLTVLEAVVYGICHEGMTRDDANQALARFKDQYFDWNEVRVSSLVEIQQTLSGFPNAEERARRIRKFLRQMFQKTYGFSLEVLVKKPLKEALKVLHDYEAFSSDFVTATVIQQALGGHAMPVDEDVRRALDRLGIAEHDLVSLRSVLERAVPKNRGVEFLDLLEDLAHDTCIPGVPECPRCELRRICPYPQAHKAEIQAAAHAKPGSSKGVQAKDQPPAKAPKSTAKEAAPPAKPVALAPSPKSTPTKPAKKHEEPPKTKSGRPKT
jgi:endonuclease-3